ncbi:hypothetical protein [Longispora albida]|uniref:hypothetical protein n=1 Tax=Longispora albida TaxID=203523 RepID=UPI0003775166|nr:hypothetical protein [Longispora albida]
MVSRRLTGWLLRTAAARWPVQYREELAREWVGEIAALEGSAWRQLAFALSLAWQRPVRDKLPGERPAIVGLGLASVRQLGLAGLATVLPVSGCVLVLLAGGISQGILGGGSPGLGLAAGLLSVGSGLWMLGSLLGRRAPANAVPSILSVLWVLAATALGVLGPLSLVDSDSFFEVLGAGPRTMLLVGWLWLSVFGVVTLAGFWLARRSRWLGYVTAVAGMLASLHVAVIAYVWLHFGRDYVPAASLYRLVPETLLMTDAPLRPGTNSSFEITDATEFFPHLVLLAMILPLSYALAAARSRHRAEVPAPATAIGHTPEPEQP